MSQDLAALRDRVRVFVAERDWERFHTPKNLAAALIVEAAELLEHFQWRTPEESMALPPEALAEVREEVADVLVYLTRLADVLGFDPVEAAFAKMEKNAAKYPAPEVRGRWERPVVKRET